MGKLIGSYFGVQMIDLCHISIALEAVTMISVLTGREGGQVHKAAAADPAAPNPPTRRYCRLAGRQAAHTWPQH